MASNMRWVVALGVGLAGGWALRRLSDSPEDAGEQLRDLAATAKERVSRWAKAEGERFDDMFAEARSRVEPDISPPVRVEKRSVPRGRPKA